MEHKKREEDLKIFYGLTIVIVPTILMAVASQYISDFFVRIISQVLILFLQAVIVHGILQNKDSF